MKLLLVETTQYAPSSPLFLDAARSLPGIEVAFIDEKDYFAAIDTSPAHRALFRMMGRRPPRLPAFEQAVVDRAGEFRPDVILIVKGAYVRPQLLRTLRRTGAILANFSTDDPFNPGVSSRYLHEAIREYDLYATPRRANLHELQAAGARNTAVVAFGYNPSVHFVEPEIVDEPGDDCDLLFVGGADRDRLAFFRSVAGLWPDARLALYGGYWDRDPVLRHSWRGFARGAAYRRAMRRARLVVNLVRRANRDSHVMRSFEVPACGGCMLAERTDDHERFFDDGRDAVLFDGPEDLVGHARRLAVDAPTRHHVAESGHRRIAREGHTYGHRLRQLLNECATI